MFIVSQTNSVRFNTGFEKKSKHHRLTRFVILFFNLNLELTKCHFSASFLHFTHVYVRCLSGSQGLPGPGRPAFLCVRIKTTGSLSKCPPGYSATSCLGFYGCRFAQPDVTVTACKSQCPTGAAASYYPKPGETLAVCCR